MKKMILAIIAVFITWSILDFIIHGMILSNAYASTPTLWRPMAEMKIGLMYFTSLVSAAGFVFIYDRFITATGVWPAVHYGLVFGIVMGIGMGYGSYSVMPIPSVMAFVWFVGSIVEMAAGGLVAGLIIKKQ